MRISDWSSDVCSSDLYLLSFSNFRTARTGLSGVQELLPGTALILGRGLPTTETFWSPWPHARESVGEVDAPMLLEQSIRTCVSAWADSQIGRASCRERVCQYV